MDAILTRPGTYVIAVSGGVDSMALLHALHQKNTDSQDQPWKLVVAHLDHGMRSDSLQDRLLVEEVARQLGLSFVYKELNLGADASEAAARTARYDFLRKVQQDHKARAIVTAHHQDDVLETAIINLLRGSGRKGLTSLGSHYDIERPLLNISKREVIAYANEQGLQWNEDRTNQDLDYLRNYVRHKLLPRFNEQDRNQLGAIITDLRTTNNEIDGMIVNQLHMQSKAGDLDRAWFSELPHSVAKETMAGWLRAYGVRDFDSKTLERLVVAAKVGAPGKEFDVLHNVKAVVSVDHLALARLER